MMNFVNIISHDYVSMSEKHKATMLYSTNSNKLDSFETLRKVFNDKLENKDTHFIDLLPILINVQTKQLSSRCYNWQINGCHNESKTSMVKSTWMITSKYVQYCIIAMGFKLYNTNYRFHTKTIKLNKCMQNTTTNMLINSITR